MLRTSSPRSPDSGRSTSACNRPPSTSTPHNSALTAGQSGLGATDSMRTTLPSLRRRSHTSTTPSPSTSAIAAADASRDPYALGNSDPSGTRTASPSDPAPGAKRSTGDPGPSVSAATTLTRPGSAGRGAAAACSTSSDAARSSRAPTIRLADHQSSGRPARRSSSRRAVGTASGPPSP